MLIKKGRSHNDGSCLHLHYKGQNVRRLESTNQLLVFSSVYGFLVVGWWLKWYFQPTNQPTKQLFVSTNQHDLPCFFFVRVKSRRDKGDTSGQRSTEPPPERFTLAVLSASTGKNGTTHTMWAPTSYKWSYNPCKWPNKWVTGDIQPTNGVITLLITGVITILITFRGPLCTFRYSSLPGCQIIQNIGESYEQNVSTVDTVLCTIDWSWFAESIQCPSHDAHP